MIMQIIIENRCKVAFTLGELDTQGNIKDPLKIIRYINSYGEFSITFPSVASIIGDSFYALPIRRLISCPTGNDIVGYLIFLDSNTNDCYYPDMS